jgi:hypothetical protein
VYLEQGEQPKQTGNPPILSVDSLAQVLHNSTTHHAAVAGAAAPNGKVVAVGRQPHLISLLLRLPTSLLLRLEGNLLQ